MPAITEDFQRRAFQEELRRTFHILSIWTAMRVIVCRPTILVSPERLTIHSSPVRVATAVITAILLRPAPPENQRIIPPPWPAAIATSATKTPPRLPAPRSITLASPTIARAAITMCRRPVNHRVIFPIRRVWIAVPAIVCHRIH